MIIDSSDKLKDLIYHYKESGRKIVTTNGCFDIIHPGHIETFRQAKESGDVLIVLVNSDNNPYFKTKPGRPINDEISRLKMLDSIRYIDIVIPFSDETPVSLLEMIKPEIHVKGGDYIKEDLPEYNVVKSHGGDILIVPILDGYSTTNIILIFDYEYNKEDSEDLYR